MAGAVVSALSELRHFAGVLRGRVHIERAAVCDRCPAITHELTRAQAAIYGDFHEAACRHCATGILHPAPTLERAP